MSKAYGCFYIVGFGIKVFHDAGGSEEPGKIQSPSKKGCSPVCMWEILGMGSAKGLGSQA